ncbi:MAG: hypothetical protein CMC14_03075 [Flavobacteriaceae bacterium]|nr:hypothetical protein [Flavobacteriaceae bacterium]|tara:strand:+ start:4173 stop:7985 length:3813 start_codon:yes stop_codon:yes gene_type:complete
MYKITVFFVLLFFQVSFSQDTTPPTAVCQDVTVTLDSFGSGSITAMDVDGGSTDDVAIASLSVSPSNFDCSDLGVVVVTLTVTDTSGNSDTCTANVTVEDTDNPVAACQDISVSLDATGNYVFTTADLQFIGAGSTDNCNSLSYSSVPNTFTCADVYNPQLIDLVITGVLDVDIDNPTPTVAVQAVEVYVIEDIPDLSLYGIGVANDGGGSDGQEFTFPAVAASAGDYLVIASNAADFATFFGFATDFESAVLDMSGDDAVELFFSGSIIDTFGDVNVDGTSEPWDYFDGWAYRKDETQANEGVFAFSNWIYSGTEIWDITDPVSGNVLIPFPFDNYTYTISGSTTPISVELTVSDDSGNTSTCMANVYVEDTTPPVANCQNITLQLNANGEAFLTAEDLDNLATPSTDNCSIAFFSADPSAFFCDDVGVNNVVLTVIDSFGNSSICNATVTIEDVNDPTAFCQNITVPLDANGMVTILPTDVDNISTDACGITTRSLDIDTFDCTNLGVNTVSLTVTDANGRQDTCTAQVTITDITPPNVVCQNITIPLDASGMASITATQIDNGSTDACGIASRTLNVSSFTCNDLGANSVTLTVTDNNGNSASCFAEVTIVDTTPPVANAMDITVFLNATGEATIVGGDVDNNSADNCGIASITVSPSSFDCSDTGSPVLVTMTVTDGSGNSSNDTAMVTVVDDSPPTAVCTDITLPLDVTGIATLTPNLIDGGSGVSCGAATLTIDTTSFDCSDIGPNTVTLTVANAAGATATCTAIVTVVDSTPPNVICQDVTVILDGAGSGTITTSDIDNGTTDACGIASLSLNTTTFDCSDVGTNTVILTATDVNGNSSSCTAIVTVLDNINPSAICQNITVSLDASGVATITPLQVDGGSSDFCGIASRSIDISSFDCNDLGANTVALTVTDTSGNIATCNAIVTVQDVIPPTAVCQNITVQLDTSGSAIITASDVDGGSTDACGIASTNISNTIFNCNNVGANSVILSVTDTSGNTSTCSATVTVQDLIPPTMSCQNITVALDASGTAFITPQDIDSGTFDACGLSSVSIDRSNFSCADLGANSVVLTATDIYGNTASCTATVTVVDLIDPSINCPSNQTVIADAGNMYIIPDYFSEGLADASDNCTNPITNVTQNPTPGSSVGLGLTTVSLTAMDSSGNSDTCSFQLTVNELLGVSNNQIEKTISIIPNPASEYITITTSEVVSIQQIKLFDIHGRKIKEQVFQVNQNVVTLDISILENAIYFVEIKTDSGFVLKRLIKN